MTIRLDKPPAQQRIELFDPGSNPYLPGYHRPQPATNWKLSGELTAVGVLALIVYVALLRDPTPTVATPKTRTPTAAAPAPPARQAFRAVVKEANDERVLAYLNGTLVRAKPRQNQRLHEGDVVYLRAISGKHKREQEYEVIRVVPTVARQIAGALSAANSEHAQDYRADLRRRREEMLERKNRQLQERNERHNQRLRDEQYGIYTPPQPP